MYRLGRTDSGKVSVALVGEYHVLGVEALDGSGYGRSTSVGGFLPVYVYVLVGKHGTAYGGYTYGLVFDPHFLNDLCYQLMYHAVATTRAVVHIDVVHQLGLLIYQVLWLDDCLNIHRSYFLFTKKR